MIGQSTRRVAFGWPAPILAACLLLALAVCQRSQTADRRQDEQFLTNVGVLLYMDAGNCLHSRRQEATLGFLRCVPAPRTICRNDALQDSSGNLIVPKGSSDRARAELGTIASEAAACADEVAAVLLLPTFRATPEAGYASIQTNNRLESVVDCLSLGAADAAKLVSKSGYAFLSSPRGTVARRARTTGDESCLEQLRLSYSERALVDAAHSGSVLLETTCFYGPGSLNLPYSNSRCAQGEREAAFSFDFASK